MGAGSSLEAGYTLKGPIKAGTWRLVADGIVLEPVDVTFEILWRQDDGDTVLSASSEHFELSPGGGYTAQPYEVTADVDRVPAEAGDRLVLRFTGEGSSQEMAFIPNGDGELAGGRIPFIDLPH